MRKSLFLAEDIIPFYPFFQPFLKASAFLADFYSDNLAFFSKMAENLPSSQEFPRFEHRPVAVEGEDDVVEDLDPEEEACLAEAEGDFKVVGAGFKAAGGVVVGDHDCGGAHGNRVGENFSGVHERAVDEPDGDDVYAHELVGTVEHDTQEMFLHPVAVMPDHLVDCTGVPAGPEAGGCHAAAELQTCADAGGLGHAESRDIAEILGSGSAAVEDIEDVGGDVLDRAAAAAGAEDGAKELKVGDSFGSESVETLAGSVVAGHLLDGSEINCPAFVLHAHVYEKSAENI